MTDCQFPVITYDDGNDFLKNGQLHGEHFRKEIKELFNIRKNLLLEKNPSIKSNLKELALIQFEETKLFANDISNELIGIAEGASLSVEDIVLLNNYTDFRDIILPNEGCSTVHSVTKNDSISGQTWDMHGSAKKYVSIIKISGSKNHNAQLIFSLVGCVGMMGFNSDNLMIGVNNLNTKNARASIVWPALIRKALLSKTYNELENTITNAPVTSGHNYQLSSVQQGAQWEVTPLAKEKVSEISETNPIIFHTNHCLGDETVKQEDTISSNSTTKNRFKILKKYSKNALDYQSVFDLLTGHEGYPKSICSHYESNTQDPSTTCGGAIGSFKQNKFKFWRGCEKHDKNYIAYNFKLSDDKRIFHQV